MRALALLRLLRCQGVPDDVDDSPIHALRWACCSGVASGRGSRRQVSDGSRPSVTGIRSELVASRDQQRHRAARGVLLEPSIQRVGADAEVVDGQDLVVDVDAGLVRRRAALHLRHDQAAAVVLRRRAEPRLARTRAGRLIDRLEAQAEPLERLVVAQLLGRLQHRRPPRAEVAPGDLVHDALELGFGEALGAGVAAVGEPHHVVEALRAVGGLADLRVEHEGDHGALRVVADRGVGRVLVGAVVLDPRVERRRLDRLRQPARRGLQLADVRRDPVDQLGVVVSPARRTIRCS